MVRYSQFLPSNFLTFQLAKDFLMKRSVEMSCRSIPQPQPKLLSDIKNVPPVHHVPHIVIQQHPISYQNSPVTSPVGRSPCHFKKENIPAMSFTYRSPAKVTEPQTPHRRFDSSLDREDIKQAAKLSLKNTVIHIRPCHMVQPSREFTSTMPNSIRNSGVFERNIFIEKLDPTPAISRKNSANHFSNEETVYKQAAQRYSEAEPIISFESRPKKTKVLKVSLDNQTKINSENIDR
jgi:hypothetical protein